MRQLPVFIDFEASSIGSGSYPIEVARNLPNGSIEAHLISLAGIDRWTDWSAEAERIHGISRSELIEKGESPAWVCRRMNDQLAGRIVYSDNPDYDSAWLSELFMKSYAGDPSFSLHHVDEPLMDVLRSRIDPEEAAKTVGFAKDEARLLVHVRHRAAKDVEYLMAVYELVCSDSPA